jgi:prepilin-type N-terminal cleavage/methylation domain-containing protein
MKRNTMKYRTLYGFTLIELIVVIVIIVMLFGLLIPTIPYARESSRRAQCLNNQAAITLGFLNYEGIHGTFPGWRQTLANGREVSWTAMLLPHIEYNKVWEILSAESLNEKEIAALSDLHIPMLTCSTHANFKGEKRMSYIVNCGKMDAEFTAVSPINPTGHVADSEPKNGVFFDHVETETKITLDFISKQNGTGYTLLTSETLQAGTWNEKPRENLIGFCFPDSSFLNQRRDICTGKDAPMVPVFINHCPDGDSKIAHGQINGLGEYRFARPASYHPGIIIASFCDRSVRSINEKIEPEIFQRLMFNDTTPIDPTKIE